MIVQADGVSIKAKSYSHVELDVDGFDIEAFIRNAESDAIETLLDCIGEDRVREHFGIQEEAGQ